jgi:hypothetical protein
MFVTKKLQSLTFEEEFKNSWINGIELILLLLTFFINWIFGKRISSNIRFL